MWLIQSTLLVALSVAGWALGPDVVVVPSDGTLIEGKYVIYGRDGVEEASVVVTKDMVRTDGVVSLRSLQSLLSTYFNSDKKRPQSQEQQRPQEFYYNVHGQGHPESHTGSPSEGDTLPHGTLILRPVPTTHRPPAYPDHQHYDGDYPKHRPSDKYPSRPHRPQGRPDRYPDRYPEGYPDLYPYPPHHNYPNDRYREYQPDKDVARFRGYQLDKDGDRDQYTQGHRPSDKYPSRPHHPHGRPDRYPDRYPEGYPNWYPYPPHHNYPIDRYLEYQPDQDDARFRGLYPYEEYKGHEGKAVWPVAKLGADAVAVPVYVHHLDKAAGKA